METDYCRKPQLASAIAEAIGIISRKDFIGYNVTQEGIIV